MKFVQALVKNIVITGANPRDRVTQKSEGMPELSASIKSVGIKVPLLLRDIPEKKGHYELLAGERRLTAAKMAGLLTVPAVTGKMEKAIGFETTVIENMHREDLSLLEQITGVASMMASNGNDAKAVADKLNMTEQQVKLRVNAQNLSKGWKKFMESEKGDELTAEHLDLIARLPENAQEDLLENGRVADRWDGVVTVKELKEKIDQNYLRTLSRAKWDLDLTVGKMPACNDCIKRSDTEQQADLWQDAKKKKQVVQCLDAGCWIHKQASVLKMAYIKAQGLHKVLAIGISGGGKVGWPLRQAFCEMTAVESCKLNTLNNCDYKKATKKDKNPTAVFMLDTGNVAMYVKSSVGSRTPKAADGTPALKTMKERKLCHHGLRLKTVYPKLKKAICECAEPKDTSLEFAAAVAAVYGTTNDFKFSAESSGKLTENQLVDLLKDGKQTEMQEGWGDGDKFTVDLAGAIWLRARGCFAAKVPGSPNADQALEAEKDCKAVAILVGYDWEKGMKEAIEEKPDPKIWNRLKADGSPK